MKQTKILNGAILILSIAASFIIGLNVNIAKPKQTPIEVNGRAYQIDFKHDAASKGQIDSILVYDLERLVGSVKMTDNPTLDSLILNDNK